jgi:hypothetical protein
MLIGQYCHVWWQAGIFYVDVIFTMEEQKWWQSEQWGYKKIV